MKHHLVLRSPFITDLLGAVIVQMIVLFSVIIVFVRCLSEQQVIKKATKVYLNTQRGFLVMVCHCVSKTYSLCFYFILTVSIY